MLRRWNLGTLLHQKKRYFIFPLDLLFVVLSYYVAGTLRFDSLDFSLWGTPYTRSEFLELITIIALTKGILFVSMGLYRSLWAYASIHDLVQIFKTTLFSSLATVMVLLFYNRLEGISRSVLILDGGILFLLLSFRSFSWRIFRDMLFSRKFNQQGKRTLIVGAGIAANRLAAELRSNRSFHLSPRGFLDDDPSKIRGNLQGLPILGPLSRLEEFLTKLEIEEVIIAAQLPGARMRKIYTTCEQNGVSCKTLPPLSELLSKPEIGKTLRDISLEDLLGRDVVNLETEGILRALQNRTILVSGAGGSIGSEVCRQLLAYQPASLILLDQAETALYEIDYELRNRVQDLSPATRILPVVGDICDEHLLRNVFRGYDIHSVFHCAAYKHVPMMEINPGEAVRNNIVGTRNIADFSRDHGVERFVMVSTDKAVNPVNIMGATKRVAELYIQNLARTTETKYITVRFGNVLGSNGSVIPLFKKQIESGGPLTVTHPDIIRYFMTIPEAAGLIIQAGVMGEEGEIFILDMGEPVRIKDLAEDMIRFAGLVPHQDIEIRYVGLRPGEKLFEELLLAEEGIQPTRHKKIHIASSRVMNLASLNEKIGALESASLNGNRGTLDAILGSLLPEYKPTYTIQYGSNLPTAPAPRSEATHQGE